MRFDRFNDDEPQPVAEVLEDGDHVCEITAEKEWTSQDGAREAVILTFTPVSGHPAFDKFFDPSEERDHKAAHQLLAAAGLAGDTDVGAGGLRGRRVRAGPSSSGTRAVVALPCSSRRASCCRSFRAGCSSANAALPIR